MENITFKCRACHTTYSVKPTLAGRTAECTKCGQRMQVPYRSPVVKLNEEMISAEEEAEQRAAAKQASAAGRSHAGSAARATAGDDDADAPAPQIVGRSFEEYEPLRKPGKTKPPKDPDQPFVPLPDILNDIWLPIAIAIVFYGLSAMLVVNYVSSSYGPGAGWVIVAMAALGIYAGVLPITVRVVEAGADSFDFKPTNALWLQVLAAMSMPLFGILFGMLSVDSTASAVTFGIIGACVALVALAIFFQTTPAKGFQTATMATLGFGVATTLTFLIVWGLSVWFIPRWGLNLPWVKPLTPEEVAALTPRPVKVAGGGTADNPAVQTPPPAPGSSSSSTPSAPAVASLTKAPDAAASATAGSPKTPDKPQSGLFDLSDVDGLGGAEPAKPTAAPAVATPKPADPNTQLAGAAPALAAGATPSISAVAGGAPGTASDLPRPADKPTKPLLDVAKQKVWTVTVVSIGQPQVDADALKTAEREAREAKTAADNAKSALRRMENDTVTTYVTDTFGRRHAKSVPRASGTALGEARTASSRADRLAGEKQGDFKRLQKDLEKSANQRLIQAVCDESGAAVEILAQAPALVKTVDGIQAGTHWTVKGTGRVDGEKVSVVATAVAAASPDGATPAPASAPTGVADAAPTAGAPAVKAAPAAGTDSPLAAPKSAPTPPAPVRE
jgi:hypothetical protein